MNAIFGMGNIKAQHLAWGYALNQVEPAGASGKSSTCTDSRKYSFWPSHLSEHHCPSSSLENPVGGCGPGSAWLRFLSPWKHVPARYQSLCVAFWPSSACSLKDIRCQQEHQIPGKTSLAGTWPPHALLGLPG